MEPIQIALVPLAVAGAWVLIELALVLRSARGSVDALDRTVEQLNSTIEEARPMVAKLDGVIDELQPAVAHIEPLLKQANIAAEALSADLIEVNGVLRDVATVSGAASSASNAVTGIADAASDKVHQLFGTPRKSAASRNPAFPDPGSSQEGEDVQEDTAHEGQSTSESTSGARRYYSYTTEEPVHE